MSDIGFQKNNKYELWRWQVFAITWLAYVAYYFTRKAFAVAKIGIAEDPSIDISIQMMGNFDGVYLACYAVGQFFWGVLADKFGSRIVVIVGMIMTACAATVMGLFPAVLVFFIVSATQGLAQSSGWSPLCKSVSNFFSTKERGRIMGLWCTSYAVGGLLATPFAGWFAYSVFDDWRYAFFAPAVLVFGVWILFIIFHRNCPQDVGLPTIEEYHNESQAIVKNEDTLSDESEGSMKAIVEIFNNKTVLLLGFVYFLLKPARYAIILWGPFIVYQKFEDANIMIAATVPIAFELAGIVGPIAIGYASDKLFGSRRMPVIIISLFLLTIALALFVPLTEMGIWATVLAFFLIGLTLYGPDSMLSTSAAMDFGTRKNAGTALGFVNGCGSIGAIFGGLLPGYFDVTEIFYGFAFVNFIAALVLLPFWNKRPATVAENDTITKSPVLGVIS